MHDKSNNIKMLDFLDDRTKNFLKKMRRLHIIKKGVQLSKKEKLSYEMLWISFINRIPKGIRDKISNFGVSTKTMKGLRDFCLVYLYVFRNMSCNEIEQKYKDFFINKYGTQLTYRGIRDIVAKYGVVRKHDEAMRNRIKMGRMDFKKRKIDYLARNIDYKKRDQPFGYKYATGLSKALVDKKISRRQLSSLLNVGISTVIGWSSCRSRVSATYQKKISQILKVDALALFTDKKIIEKEKESFYYFSPNLGKIFSDKCLGITDVAQEIGIAPSYLNSLTKNENSMKTETKNKLINFFYKFTRVNTRKIFEKIKKDNKTFYIASKLKKKINERCIKPCILGEKIGLKRSNFLNILKKSHRLREKTKLKIESFLESFFKLNEKILFVKKSKTIDIRKGNYLWAVALNPNLIKSGKTQEDLARHLKVKNHTVSRWANLKARVSPKYAKLIAEYLNTMIDKIFRTDTLIDGLLKLTASKKEYYLDVKRIYDETGSLAETGRRLNITRERVRQILEKGSNLDLFEYRPKLELENQ